MAWNQVDYSDSIYRERDQGDPVCDIQRFLYTIKHSQTNVEIDGLYGAGTRRAVEFYQSYGRPIQLEVDGVVGPRTWEAMEMGPGGLTNDDNRGAKLSRYGC